MSDLKDKEHVIRMVYFLNEAATTLVPNGMGWDGIYCGYGVNSSIHQVLKSETVIDCLEILKYI